MNRRSLMLAALLATPLLTAAQGLQSLTLQVTGGATLSSAARRSPSSARTSSR